jgi:hypothetical protein
MLASLVPVPLMLVPTLMKRAKSWRASQDGR